MARRKLLAVFILQYNTPVGNNADHIALQIQHIVVNRRRIVTLGIGEGVGIAIGVIGEVQLRIAIGLLNQLATGIDIVMDNAVNCPANFERKAKSGGREALPPGARLVQEGEWTIIVIVIPLLSVTSKIVRTP